MYKGGRARGLCMASEPTQSDIAEQLRELADEIEGGENNPLPEVDGYQMVGHLANGTTFDLYKDGAGELWIKAKKDHGFVSLTGGLKYTIQSEWDQ